MKESCIILADKHLNILEGIRGLIEDLAGGVVMVSDQPSLFKALDQMKPKLAIIDLGLLGQRNIETACELNRRFPDIDIIVLSQYDDPEIVDQVMAAGASGYVLKSYAGSDLFEAIEHIQKEEIFISPAITNKQHSQEQKERTGQ